MATDFILAGYAAIKALMLADADVINPTGGVRRFVWLDEENPWPDAKNKKPGMFIETQLDWDTQTDSMRTDTQTFGNTQAASGCPFIETETHEYLLTLTGDNVLLPKISSAITEIKKALRAAATVDVGAGAVARVGKVTSRNVLTSKGEAAGTMRRVVKMRIPVTIVYSGTTQTT